MKILGIVAEFNPFHNGHKYLIEEAKKITGADACIIVMSGNFVQRGEAAIIDKFNRAKMAVLNGADIVIELPTIASTASAEGFAYGAVSLLNSLNCVDSIAFGSEYDNLELINEIAAVLVNEPQKFKETIRAACENGVSYPVARTNAILNCFNKEKHEEISNILSSPNSILAIEYVKSLIRLNSKIKPVIIKRIGAGYNDITKEEFSSATGIRNFIKNDDSFSSCIPDSTLAILNNCQQTNGYIFEEDVFNLLLYKLLTNDTKELSNYSDSNEFIANKIKNNLYKITSYQELINALSSKEYTLSRIKRVLIHILLGITNDLFPAKNYKDYASKYARIISCVNEEMLSVISRNSKIPVIVKLSKQDALLNEKEKELLELDINANNIYQSILAAKFNVCPENEYTKNIFPKKNG